MIYNNFDDSRKLCQSLADQTPADFDLTCVLVDNSDASDVIADILALASEFEFVEVLTPEKNMGYFPAISLALQQYADGYDYVVAGNNDLIYDPSFTSKLVQKTYEDPIMVVCPDIVTADGVHQNPHHKRRLAKWQRLYFDVYFSHYSVGRLVNSLKKILLRVLKRNQYFAQDDTVQPKASLIDQGVGACYIFLPSFLQKAGNQLYYEWFLYGEEACLSWQVKDLKGVMWYDPELSVWHAESATLSKISTRQNYEFARSSFWNYRKLL
ncbi:glycosyltransferase [Ascidiaceihabitans sp.]|nr:glycosyltransferase [Ascidiaceihabitans sp.]MDA9136419.1 glycosyltransferase [Ascidiaceihabitans sp.]